MPLRPLYVGGDNGSSTDRTSFRTGEDAGSNPVRPSSHGHIAQSVEHWTETPERTGSIPVVTTMDAYLIVVDSGFACFGLIVDQRLRVVAAPPIAKYAKGWTAKRAKGYFRGRGFDVKVFDLPS